MRSPNKSYRAAIIGGRNFSAADLYSLLTGGVVAELVVLDEDGTGRLIDEVKSRQEAFPAARPARIFPGNYRMAATAEIVVIAAGTAAGNNEPEFERLDRNAGLIREITRRLMENHFAGVILITTNPVDIMAPAGLEASGLPAGRVIGSGRVLETKRFGKPSGGIATWCAAQTGSHPLVDFCRPNCPGFGDMLAAIGRAAPTGIGREQTLSPPLTAAGSCVTRICEAVLRDERVILPVCAMIPEHAVYLNWPCVIGSGGVEQILRPELTDAEKQDLRERAAMLKRTGEILKKKSLAVNQT